MERLSIESALRTLHDFFDGEWCHTDEDLGENGILVNGIVIHLFIVGQTQSYQNESERGYLYSLQQGYPRMYEVKPGDIIFSCYGGRIMSINVALSDAEKTYGVQDGLKIECVYSKLNFPLVLEPLRQRLSAYIPFDVNGHLPQRGYIHRLQTDAAHLMINKIKALGNTAR